MRLLLLLRLVVVPHPQTVVVVVGLVTRLPRVVMEEEDNRDDSCALHVVTLSSPTTSYADINGDTIMVKEG
jgi:hypothetical protein